MQITTGRDFYLGTKAIGNSITGITHDSATGNTVIDKLSVTNNIPFLTTYRSYFHFDPNRVYKYVLE